MSVKAFRLQNFMPFEDTRWIELKPICLLFGRNSSGKSAIIRALRFLRQSLNSDSSNASFLYYAEHGVDVGDYKTVVHGQHVSDDITFSFRCELENILEEVRNRVNAQRAENGLRPIPAKSFTNWIDVELTYSWNDADTQALLKEFKIVGPWNIGTTDKDSCVVFGAQQLPSSASMSDDAWWFWSEIFPGYETETETAWSGVSVITTHGFLPTLKTPTRHVYADLQSFNDLQLVEVLLQTLCDDVREFLRTFDYLGPIRPQPQRVYAFDPLTSLRWKRLGWSAFLRFLKGELDQKLIEQIETWMAALDLGSGIKPDKENYAGDLAVVAQVKVQDSAGLPINLVDTGYGASQVLPIIIECVLAERDVLVIIEQPELHLHPRAQAQLADLLIETAMRSSRLEEQRKREQESLPTRNELKSIRVRLLVETHSEHILLRLRRRIAESSQGKFKPSEVKYLDSEALAVYYVDPDEKPDQSVVQPISIDARGSMITPRNFRGFFADDLKETAFLAGARLGMTVDWESNEE